VTIILFFLWSLRPDGRYDAVVNFVTPIVAVLVIPLVHIIAQKLQLGAISKIISGIIISMLVMIALPNAVLYAQVYLRSGAGREVRGSTSSWPVKQRNSFDANADGWGIHEDSTEYGASTRQVRDGNIILTLDSPRDATTWVGSELAPVSDFFVSVDIIKLSGPENSYCGMLFGFNNPSDWYSFRVKSDQSFAISHHTGGNTHRQIAGPTNNSAINKEGVNNVMIFAINGIYRFFINDVLVYTDNLPVSEGVIDLMAQAPTNPSIIRCGFDNFELRIP